MTRRALPNRRPTVSFTFSHGGQDYHVGLGRYDDGSMGDAFLTPLGNAGKGSAIEALARDAAILISLGVQFGVPVETMRRAITRDGDGAAATLIGAALDALEG